MHVVDIAPIVARHAGDPFMLAQAWERETHQRVSAWHNTTVQFDRIRGPEVEAFRQHLPDPHDPKDPTVARTRAFNSACHYDAQVLNWFGEQSNCLTLPAEVASTPGVVKHVFEVASANPPYQVRGPDRAELELLLA